MKNINEVEANEIDIKPFKVKDNLNPEFFNDEGQLNSQIRMRLLDIADDFVEDVEAHLRALKKLRAPHGIYVVLGNHEVYYNALQWETAFAAL
ncbi:MAG: hypothetical protein II670_03190, partial [Alphaproteobacteria bacterium]|nr:hypothetical protein [Alphaproteobacteria bacterium]